MTGFIKRTVGYHAPQNVNLVLYNTLVRNKPLWSPQNVNTVVRMESIQRAATRSILNYGDLDYRHRCEKLNILPLSYRREIADLVLFYKFINVYKWFPKDNYVTFYDQSNRLRINICDGFD